ncbi:MAG: hypothetical protein WKF78_04295 [Candidatus Limnocylindrales bacterium]
MLGQVIVASAGSLRFDVTWAAIILGALTGIVFYLAIVVVERLVIPWHASVRGSERIGGIIRPERRRACRSSQRPGNGSSSGGEMQRTRTVLALVATASFVFAACSTGGGASTAPTSAAASSAPSASAASTAPETHGAPASTAPESTAPESQELPASTGAESPAASGATADVRLQLQWVPQAQFAGYLRRAPSRATTRPRAST